MAWRGTTGARYATGLFVLRLPGDCEEASRHRRYNDECAASENWAPRLWALRRAQRVGLDAAARKAGVKTEVVALTQRKGSRSLLPSAL